MLPPRSCLDVSSAASAETVADQRLGREDVVAHRGEDLVGRVRQADRVLRLLAERGDVAPVGGGLDHAELVGLLDRGAQRRDRHALARRDVLLDHLARVHAVDVVGAEDDDVLRPLVGDQVVVLEDRVGGAHEPARPEPHLRRHRRDVVAQQRRQAPRGRDVAVEAVALVLRQHHDLVVVRVDQVREREVDQPVVAAERHGGLGAVGGQRREALALAAGQHHRRAPCSCRGSPARRSMICSRCSSPLRRLGVELVDVLGARRAGRRTSRARRRPSRRRSRASLPGARREHRLDRLARELGRGDVARLERRAASPCARASIGESMRL